MVRSKLGIVFFIQLLIIVVLIGVIFFQKLCHYKEINQIRLDPLEAGKQHFTLGDGGNDFWVIGDSRAEQWDTSLLNFLRANVYNLGIGGQSTKQVLERFEDDLKKHCPKYVLIQVGINDLKNIRFPEGENITNNCINNTLQILDLCKERNIVAIYTSIFPIGNIEFFRRPFWEDCITDSIKKVNVKIKDYCSENSIYYFDSYSVLAGDKNQNIVRSEYQKDFLHLSKEGYVALSKKLSDFLSGY